MASGTLAVYDVIVVGVGGMGSATVYQLARSGCRVLGLDRFPVPHAFGSSHGSTRIIRLAYSEGSRYVPLLRAAYRYWRELEAVSGESILVVTGGLDIGPPDSGIVEGSRRSCLEHGIAFAELDGAEVNRRFPGYRVPASARAIYQADAGFVRSQVAIRAHVAAARALGADIQTGAPVRTWAHDQQGFRVETDSGTCRARQLVITAGAWTAQLVPEIASLCRPERQVMLWTEPPDAASYEPHRFPVFILHAGEGPFYGVPNDQNDGFKIGKFHHRSEQVPNPDCLDRTCSSADEATLREGIVRYFPGANGPTRRMVACMFTNSDDGHFVLDRHPCEDGVFIAAGFSGHGYKFCSVIGRIMADFCLGREAKWPIRGFRIGARVA